MTSNIPNSLISQWWDNYNEDIGKIPYYEFDTDNFEYFINKMISLRQTVNQCRYLYETYNNGFGARLMIDYDKMLDHLIDDASIYLHEIFEIPDDILPDVVKRLKLRLHLLVNELDAITKDYIIPVVT